MIVPALVDFLPRLHPAQFAPVVMSNTSVSPCQTYFHMRRGLPLRYLPILTYRRNDPVVRDLISLQPSLIANEKTWAIGAEVIAAGDHPSVASHVGNGQRDIVVVIVLVRARQARGADALVVLESKLLHDEFSMSRIGFHLPAVLGASQGSVQDLAHVLVADARAHLPGFYLVRLVSSFPSHSMESVVPDET